MATSTRRPLLGILLLLVVALVAGATLSSPPWPGASPAFGIPRDSCGRMGAALAAFLLGHLGVPLSFALWLFVSALASRFLLGLPRSPWRFLTWLLTTAFVFSVFVAGLGDGLIWGEVPESLSRWLASGARLGPVGAGLLSGAIVTLLVFWAAPRWIPLGVQDRAGVLAAGARDRMAELPAATGGLTARFGAAAATMAERLRSRSGDPTEGSDARAEEARGDAALGGPPASAASAARAGATEAEERGRRATPTDLPEKGPGPFHGLLRGLRRISITRPQEPVDETPVDPRRAQRVVRVAPGVAEALRAKAGPDARVLAAVSGHPRTVLPDEEWPGSDGFAARLRARSTRGELAEAPGSRGRGPGVDVSRTRGARDAGVLQEEEDEGLSVDDDGYEEEYEEYEDGEELDDGGEEEGDEEEVEDAEEEEDEDAAEAVAPVLIPRAARPKPARKSPPRVRRGAYQLPSLDLLEPPKGPVGTVSQMEVLEKSRILVRTLEDFGIQGKVGEVHPGPVITQYEYAPAAGVRISQIVSRSDDIALNLRAARIRIVAPIPGKAAIGIEVPNHQAEHIDFRTVLEELDLSDAHLPLCLGRDIRGRAQYGRLEKMPHLLVAGTTGSGKSVCLNACLFSLLYNRTPDELRLLLIDPKMLELTVYDGIPHLLCPVVTDARMAARMLQWMVGEMERRYRKMATFGVRNIEGYHEKMKDKRVQREAEPMPYIVVIVDELADLMLTLGNEIETPIARLAQMARAVGIHLILATQRPSVDVITGVIKANFPGRIAFQVATKVDSRTIIDANGAQDLLGKGDMLYMPPGKGQSVRLHGCFVSDQDAERLVNFLKEMPEPEAIFREDMLDKEGDGADIDDELFEDALRLVVFQQQASVSFLQRRLKVGYSRAGRLMDLLEAVGAVGPHEGSKAREILADQGFLDAWLARENKIAER